MTRTRPFRTMIRHFSHRFLTDGLTCIRLLLCVRASSVRFVRAELGTLFTEANSVGVGQFVLASDRTPKAPQ